MSGIERIADDDADGGHAAHDARGHDVRRLSWTALLSLVGARSAAVRARRGRSRGSGRTSRAGRRPGRRRARRATCVPPSTSESTAVTRATWSAKKRSCASARRDGCTRTRLPLATRAPRRSTTPSVSGAHRLVGSGVPPRDVVRCRRRRSRMRRPATVGQRRAGRAGRRAAAAGRRRHLVAAVDDLRGPRVGGPGLGLLLVGHRHHPQGEDLVDLGGVEQRAGALAGDLGVVVEDDRRAQHHVGRRPASPASTGPAAVLAAARPRRRRVVGRLEQRDEAASCRLDAAGGRRSASAGSRRPCAVAASGCGVPHGDGRAGRSRPSDAVAGA